MGKTIKLNETQLNSLIKRIIKEVEEKSESVDASEMGELDNEVDQLQYELDDPKLPDISDIKNSDVNLENSIEQEVRQKIANKNMTSVYDKNMEVIDREISNLESIAASHDLCTRKGRRQARREIFKSIFNFIRKNKNKKVNEQILPGILLGVGWILVAFFIVFWKRIIYGDNCRRWSRWKQTKMSGYGGRGW